MTGCDWRIRQTGDSTLKKVNSSQKKKDAKRAATARKPFSGKKGGSRGSMYRPSVKITIEIEFAELDPLDMAEFFEILKRQ